MHSPQKPLDFEHVVVYSFHNSLFPELIELIGLEKAVEVVRIFGGTTIEIPSIDSIQQIMRDYDIFHALRKINPESKATYAKAVAALGDMYRLTSLDVERIYNSMAELSKSDLTKRIRAWGSRRR